MLALPATLTHDQAAACARDLTAQVSGQSANVVIDASALQRFDSSALAVLLDCRRAAVAKGLGLAVRAMPTDLQQLAKVYGVAELLPST